MFIFNAARFGIKGKEIVALKKGVVFTRGDPSKTYVVFNVEGLHSLSSTLDKTKINKVEVLNNLDELSSKLPILFVNITHLEQYPFCNHAYGIQFVSDEDFRPTGNRISADGVDIIKHCYEKNIMIDVKHMSLASRRMLIENVRASRDFQIFCNRLFVHMQALPVFRIKIFPIILLSGRNLIKTTIIYFGVSLKYMVCLILCWPLTPAVLI